MIIMNKKITKKLTRAVINSLVVGVIILTLFPLVWFVQIALKPEVLAWEMPPKFIFMPTFNNFVKLLTGNKDFFGAMKSSLIVSVFSTGVSLFLGLTSGYALARSRYKFSKYMGSWIILTSMAPSMIFLIPFYNIFRALRLSGSYLSLIISYLVFTVPFVTWMMYGYFKTIPEEIEESAKLDGCSRAQILFKIAAPVALPGIVTCIMFSFIYTWNEFLFPLVLSGRGTKTIPIMIQGFMSSDGYDWGQLAATAIVIILPVLLVSIINQKGVIRGLTGGAIK